MSAKQSLQKTQPVIGIRFIKLCGVILFVMLWSFSGVTGTAGQSPLSATATAEAVTPAAEPVTVVCPPGLTRRAAVEPTTPVSAEQPSQESPGKTPPVILNIQGCVLMATLVGFSTGPGRPINGFGFIALVLDPGKNQICFATHLNGIKWPATAMHIHYRNGGIAMILPAPTQANTDGCAEAPPVLIQALLANPGDFWVNIHNADFSTGAVRGWLKGAILLQGAGEIPPGDPAGWGVASFAFDPDNGKICDEINVANIKLPGTVTHIHIGKAGAVGATAVVLAAPDARGYATSCSDADPGLIKSIMDNPTGYYVNVHNPDFPKSALRGQFPKVLTLSLCPPALTGRIAAKGASADQNTSSGDTGTAEVPSGPAPQILNGVGCTVATTLVPLAGTSKSAATGWGTAVVVLNTDSKQICYALHVSGINLPATGASIRRTNGQMAMALKAPAQERVDACVDADPTLIQDLRDRPEHYLIDVRTADFPNGAIQGQLQGAILLQGAGEIPPGDPKGWGWAAFSFDSNQGKVCYVINVVNVALPGTVAHIHQAGTGSAGATVVVLAPPDKRGYVSACTDADPGLIRDILDDPTGYYVNVHNADFPKSALRGQFPPH